MDVPDGVLGVSVTPEALRRLIERMQQESERLYRAGSSAEPDSWQRRMFTEVSILVDDATLAIQALVEQVEHRRKLICLHCDEAFPWPTAGEDAKLGVWKAMLAHDAACQENPNVQRIADLEASLAAVIAEREQAQAMFWPPKNEREARLYEIRNGKNAEYVEAHADALIAEAAEAQLAALKP